MAVSKQERDDFRAFCVNATDSQLKEIIRKERLAGFRDTDRAQFATIAESVAAERGLT